VSRDSLAKAEEALKRTEETSGVIQLDSQARAQITAREVHIQGIQTYATGENAQLARHCALHVVSIGR
jgi:hypothetical protein